VAVAAGSDAPFGPLDPWVAIQAAVDRRTQSGSTVGPGERLSPATARSLFSGRADRPGDLRRVAVGEPGDLCLIGGHASTSAPGTTVLATVVDGTVIYER
jgi:predicted amidohydrolase YtcJ